MGYNQLKPSFNKDFNKTEQFLIKSLTLEHKIKYIPVDSYSRKNERTKTVMAFAQTRHESKLIDSFLEKSNTKYLRQVLH